MELRDIAPLLGSEIHHVKKATRSKETHQSMVDVSINGYQEGIAGLKVQARCDDDEEDGGE